MTEKHSTDSKKWMREWVFDTLYANSTLSFYLFIMVMRNAKLNDDFYKDWLTECDEWWRKLYPLLDLYNTFIEWKVVLFEPPIPLFSFTCSVSFNIHWILTSQNFHIRVEPFNFHHNWFLLAIFMIISVQSDFFWFSSSFVSINYGKLMD